MAEQQKSRHKRRSPRWPGDTIQSFATRYDTSPRIVDDLVRAGRLDFVSIGITKILTPLAHEQWARMWGVPAKPAASNPQLENQKTSSAVHPAN